MAEKAKKIKQAANEFITMHLTPIPFVQKMMFIENMRVLFAAGIPIVEAIKILTKQAANAKMHSILNKIGEKVEKGSQLSESLDEFPDFFPNIYVRMMAAGEASGKLEDSLKQIGEQMKKSHNLKSKIRGAMIYPIILIVALIGIGVEMMVYVLPKLLVVFEEVNAELPLPTRMLIATSHLLVDYGLWILAVIIILIVLFIIEYRKTGVKRIVHFLLLKLPIIGKIIKKINLARFSTTLFTLLASGVPIIEAFKITADVIPNLPYKEVVTAAVEKIKMGNEISPHLEAFPALFPPMVSQMIAVGEKSGNTETMLSELAKFLGDEVDETLKNISTVIEPIMILFLGVVVAAMAIAVIMPLYSLAQSI